MNKSWIGRLGVLVAVILLVGTGFTLGSSVTAQDNVPLNLEYESIFANVYEQVAPSVVSISVVSQRTEDNPFFDEDTVMGGGTGFVYDTQGRIVTNSHVVDGAESIEVRFLDGTIARGETIGADPDSDIAVVQVENVPAERLRPVTFGDSNNLVVGQATLAIGSPFSQSWTLTSGIISALNRSIRGLADFSTGAVIQTDAAINPGNSGGPLLNLDGQVIGVNSQIISNSRSNSGVGFAVPSNLVQRVVTEIIETGEVNYSYLGISGGDMTLELIESYNTPNNLQGAVVRNVVPGGPAAQSGMQGESNASVDVITGANNTDINNFDDLLAYLANNTRPGDTVDFAVYRAGETIRVPVTLGARPSSAN